MNISSYIAHRIAFNRQKSFSRFIIRLSVTATVISVATMLITLSFVNGFQQTVSAKVFSFWGHIRISSRQPVRTSIAEEEAIHANDTIVQTIKKINGVQAIHPFATKYATLKGPEELEGVLLKGFDKTYDSGHLASFMQPGGRWIQYNDSSYSREIVLSTYTAAQLKVKLNDRLLIYFIRPDGSIRPDRLTIVGLYKTGIEEYDKTFAIGDLALLQKLNSWNKDEIGGYEIFINDYHRMDAVSNAIYDGDAFPITWETRTIRQIYPNIFDWLNVQDLNQAILLIIMVVIAVINLITCLIILVLERLRMIGTLKALGASDWTVQKIFFFHSLWITLTGILIGTVLGLGLLWLQQATGFVKLQEEAYYMSTAVVIIRPVQVLGVCAGTFIVSFLILLIPSLIVKKIHPIKAIRFS